MDLLKKEFILVWNGYLRIFRCNARSLSTRPRELHQNYTVQIRREQISRCNERFLNLNSITTFDVIRRFLCNTKTNFNASNDEPSHVAVKIFQEYLRSELDVVKLKLEQIRNHAVEKDGYVKLHIELISGNTIKFWLKHVIQFL